MNNPNAFASAFGNSGGGMSFGSSSGGGSTASAFGNTNPTASAFGGNSGGGGGKFTSAFGNNTNNSNYNSGASAFNQGNSNPNFAFNSNSSGYNTNNSNLNNGPGGYQAASFDASGNMIGNTDSQRGGRGRGRGNSYRGGGSGGRGGSNRGGGNMTYVAPGLSTGSHHSSNNNSQAQVTSAFSTGASGDSGSAFPTQGSSRGRGSGYPRGGGTVRGARGGGGQYKSLQWRPDGAQNQRSDQNQSSFSQSIDSPMSMDNSMDSSGFGSGSGGFQQQQQQQQVQQKQQSQHGSSFSTFSSGQNQKSTGFSINTKSAFGGGGATTATTTNGTVQSAFGGTSLTSASVEARAGRGFPASSMSNKSDSVFAVPAPRQTSSSSNNSQQFGARTSGPSAFSTQQKSENRASRTHQQDLNNVSESADSRLARFTAVPIGNKYDELKVKRVKEREDAIRRGAIPDPEKRGRLEDAITFVGTCMDMCPEFERHEREYQQNVEKFEKIPNTEHINHARAVKAYARPAAGVEQPLPSDVRPPDVLLSTLDYLVTEIVDDNDLSDSHAFVRDRTRSIRQDFTLQNNRGIEAVQAHETIARYHILCSHQLCENENFSEQQEMEQLRKVLTSLQEFYDDMRREGIPCPNEAEFRAYHILSHLRDPDMVRQAQQLPSHIFMDPYIQVATEIHALTRRNNDIKRRAKVQSEASPNFFSRFFKLVQGPKVSYLMACLLETNFAEIRKGALKALNKSYLDQHEGFPVRDLVNVLGFDDDKECIANCEEYDLALTYYGHAAVVFGRRDQNTRRRIFKEGTRTVRQHKNLRIVESKRQNYSAAQIIYGETPGPQQINALASGSQFTTPSISSRPPVMQPPRQLHTVSASTSNISRFGPPVATAVDAAAGAPAFGSSESAIASRPAGVFDFGLSKPPGQTALTPASSISNQASGLATSSASQLRPHLGPTPNQPSLSIPFPSAVLGPSINLSAGKPTHASGFAAPSPAIPAVPNFNAPAPGGFSFNVPQLSTSASSSITSAGSILPPSQPPFAFKVPETTSAGSFTTGRATLPAAAAATPLFTVPSPLLQSVPTALTAQPKPSITTSPSISTTGSRLSTPPPPSPISAPPKSDATRIVTRRGRIYPRSVIESFLKDFLDRETGRVIRMTAAQVSQEVVVERSLHRARERQSNIRNQSELVLADVIAQVTEEITEEILADLYRETKLKKKVITQWREFTRKCRQRAEELRRRQEHFLNNVRAMGSRAGLTDGNPMAAKIREYNVKQQRIRSSPSSEGMNGQSSMESIANKRKRMLSIGQEGSPDLALVAGLKKVVEPKRELQAPLPVLKIVESRYHSSAKDRPNQQLQDMAQTNFKGPALTKRRWRLFVNTPMFKENHSKWLLTKLGVDMSRHTKAQQRSGIMTAIHRSQSSDENAMDMVVCGVEDQSVKDLLGMSKYAILETAAFIFEFSNIPFSGHDATEDSINQYWKGESQRLMRFLACFPKVKQPIVLILWTEAREMWERVSPRMIELLNLNQMVGSPNGPLLSYNFLNLSMSGMQLDPYIIGSLEWLASETKDFFEEPSVLLRNLLEKYRPIYEWALCRIALADGPLYSQFDEDDEEEAHRWLVRENERKKQLANGGNVQDAQSNPPRNLFVEATESGFNLAVNLFNLELESIAQTIEAKGQGETREGAEQEGKVKDAMARFVRQAALPPMRHGAIQERINFGMDPKGAFCDYMDVYVATLGGIAKEHQNLKAKAAMRMQIWEMLTNSREDRVPIEEAFKCISSQIIQWVEAGILDTERFSVRMSKLDQQRLDLRWQQGQYKALNGYEEDANRQEDVAPQPEVAFKPILIHDEVDVEGNVFDFEITVQSDIRAWEKQIEKQARDREERALAVLGEIPSRSRLTLPNGPLRFGDSRKRRAPERPRDSMKKTRIERGEDADFIEDVNGEGDDDDNLFLIQTSTPAGARASLAKLGEQSPQSMASLSRQSPIGSQSDTKPALSAPVQHLHELLQAYTNKSNSSSAETARETSNAGIPTTSFSWSTPNFSKGTIALKSEQPRTTPAPVTFASAAPTSITTQSSASTAGVDRLSRLRNLIKEVKTTTLQQ
ncbi:hypothetical protein BGX21_008597 [Mortierella sp. AD011]|nr:hypothetical protein BGX21_008597 [Mortierella sp. AD011]